MGVSPSYVPVQRNGQPAEFTAVQAESVTVSGETSTGSLAVTGTATAAEVEVTGAATVGGALTVSGETSVQGLTVHQPASMNVVHAAATDATQLTVTGKTTTAEVEVTGAATVGGTLTVTGYTAAGAGQFDGQLSLWSGTADALRIGTAGGGLAVAEGADATSGVVTLAAGTATVPTSRATADARIQVTVQELGTVTDPQPVAVTARTAGTSFTIRSADATDTSVVAWWIVTPATVNP